MVDEIKNKETKQNSLSNWHQARRWERKRYNCYLNWQQRISAFAVLYLQNIYSIATLYVWKPHKHLHVWERQKKAMIAVGLLEGIWSISITVLICCELLHAVVGGWLLWDCLDECLDQSALLSPLMRSHCSSTRTHKPISAFQMSRGVFSHTHKREQGVQGAKTQTHIRKKT